MQYFDLHCDTLYKAVCDNSSINNSGYEVSVNSGCNFDKWCQCMAVWIPDSLAQSKRLGIFKKAYNLLMRDSNEFAISPFYNKDLKKHHKFIFTLENSAIVDNDLKNISMLAEHGVKMATLTWNDSNCIGGGADTQETGLTDFGKECIEEFENQQIIIDVSHASDRTFYDVMECATKPIAASHSNSRTVCNHRRNLTDTQFIEIVRRNGIVGINFHKDFLSINRDSASLSDVIKHTEHFLSLGGENVICIGSDFDGADPIKELSNINKIQNLYESFLKIGYNEQLVQKIMYNNAYNFFSRF